MAEQERFVRLQRQLARQNTRARKTKDWDSRRRRRTLDRLAVLRRRLADRRTDWVEQTTTHLARSYDLIAVEDLQVRNMVRRPQPKPDPGRPGVFLANGAKAKAALNTAILASVWGRRESQAVFGCEACKHQAHADTNAAVVILARALKNSTAAGHAVSGRASPALAGCVNRPAA